MNATPLQYHATRQHAKAYAIDGRGVDATDFYALACDPQIPVAVQACAGAGKTWMLVSRMLRALLGGARGDEVLAITFTKKAAAEMRDRLMDLLAEFSAKPLEACAQELQTRGMSEAQSQAHAAAFQSLYVRLLRQGENLQVRTFHSWFSSLLDMAPQDLLQALNLPLEYTLVEDDSRILDALWPSFWQKMASDPALMQHYLHALRVLGDAKLMDALKAVHQRRQERHFMRDQTLEDQVPAWPPTLPKPDGVHDLADHLASPSLRQRWLSLSTSLGRLGGARSDAAAQAIEQAFADASSAPQERVQALRKALLTDKGQARAALSKWADRDDALAMLDDLDRIARQEEAAHLHASVLALAQALDALYQAHKKRNMLIDMVDLEEVAHRLLTDDELSGWLQERLDWQFRYLLIDEFQDTSPLQWQALSTWLSSYAGHTSQRAPVVFIVGDPKQSIYRFRRAEPKVFLSAQTFVTAVLGGHLLSCDHTRRNAQSIVDAVNRVFEPAEGSAGMQDFRTHTTQSEEEGEIIVLPMIERSENANKALAHPDDPAFWPWRDSLAPQEETTELRLLERQCRMAAARLLAVRHRLELHRQPGAPAIGCMVLARKRDRLRTMYQVLQSMGVAADMPEKDTLQDHSAVQDVIALVSVLLSRYDDLSLARALKSPIFAATDLDLITLSDWRDAHAPEDSLLDALLAMRLAQVQASSVSAALIHAADRMERWLTVLKRGSMHELLQTVYTDQQLLEQYVPLSEPLHAERVKAALCALLFQALQLEGGRFLTPQMWLAAWTSAPIAAPAPTSASNSAQFAPISLLTIHGAKGLEADLVLVLDAAAASEPRDAGQVLVDWPAESAHPTSWIYLSGQKHAPESLSDLLMQERMERSREEINALYVAMTRAKRCLMVAASEPQSPDNASWWSRLQEAGFLPMDKQQVEGVSAPLDTDQAHIADQSLHPWALSWEPLGWTEAQTDVSQRQALPNEATVADAARNESSIWATKGEALHWLLERAAPSKWPGTFWSDRHVLQFHERNRAHWGLDKNDLEWTMKTGMAVLQGPAQWAWDTASLLWSGNEVSIVHQSDLLRIDRLVHHAEHGIWVLDYKSSLRPDHHPSLSKQLKRYQEAVQALEQETVHAGFITADGTLIPIV
jgi:ATP-dependent helicase/nuclease subunit A